MGSNSSSIDKTPIIEEEEKKEEEEENPKLEKEKDDILRGKFEERFKVEKKDPTKFYDMIININTFSQKPDIIWTIETKTELKINFNTTKEEKEKEEKEKQEIVNKQKSNEQNKSNEKIEQAINEDQTDKTIIGILGLGNVGKSYLLSLFMGQELPTGDSIHTKGISIKTIDNLVILDSEGVEAPLTKTNVLEELYPKESLLTKSINESDSMIQKIARDKKAVESFIQDFVLEKSDILVIVVGQLTFTEQKLINRIVTETNKNNIFIIHNLKNLYTKDQITDYIENTFKKNIFLKQSKKFSEQTYKGIEQLKNKEEEFDKYFIEIYDNIDGNEKKVIHLIMASNVEESEAYCFNKTVVDYIRTEITIFNEGKKFNIFNELKDFLVKRGRKYVESQEGNHSPFSEEDIKIEKDGNKKCIKIKNNNNRLKKCLINQLGFSSFFGALYSPNYICYIDKNEEKKEKKLVIEINTPGKCFEFENPKREEYLSEDGHKMIIYLTGTKKLNQYNTFESGPSTMDSGNFRIDIVLDYNKYRFKENAKVEKKKLKGITRFSYPLIFDDNINSYSEMKAVTVDFSKNEKKN